MDNVQMGLTVLRVFVILDGLVFYVTSVRTLGYEIKLEFSLC